MLDLGFVNGRPERRTVQTRFLGLALSCVWAGCGIRSPLPAQYEVYARTHR